MPIVEKPLTTIWTAPVPCVYVRYGETKSRNIELQATVISTVDDSTVYSIGGGDKIGVDLHWLCHHIDYSAGC